MSYLGDFNTSVTIRRKFTTVTTSGAPTQLAGSPAISVYKDGSTTQSTTGVTLTVDFDSVTGFNEVAIDLSADGTFYSAGSDFAIVITTGTVGGTSVVGYCVGSFSIENRSGETARDRVLLALPNAAADAAGGLPISDAGGLDLDARLDAAVSSRMATYTQPTGFLAATFPTTVASTTNITAGTITTVTNLTNAPTSGDLTATMKTSVETAVNNQLVANNLDHLILSAVDTDFATTVHLDSVIGQLAQTADGGYSRATDSLEAIRDRGDVAWTTATSVTVSDKTGFKLASDGLALVTAWTVAITGDITGNLSGSAGSVTANVNAVLANTAHGGTSATLRLGGSTSTPALYVTNSGGAAVQFESTASGGQAGLYVKGSDLGPGMRLDGGDTSGAGLEIVSNGDDGVRVSSIAGHAVNLLVTNGVSKHGLLITGGTSGTSDGMKLVAGSGGVGLRADTVTTSSTVTLNALTVSGATTLTGALTATNASNNITLGTFTVTTNAISWNASWDTEIQSEVQDAIEVNNLDHLVGTATGIPAIPAGTYIDQIMDDGTATFDRTTDSLQAVRDNMGTLTTSERDSIAAALLDLSNGIETGVTPRQAIRAVSAILAGIVSGAGTGTEVFKAIAAASGGTTRVTVTVDSSGNRSALTLNL